MTFIWNNSKVENLNKCIEDIEVDNFLDNNAFNLGYKISYKKTERFLKIVPILDEKNPNIWTETTLFPLYEYTTEKDFKKEIQILEKLSNKNISPKLYESGICDVSRIFFPIKKSINIKVGFIVLELFDISISNKIDIDIDKLIYTDLKNEQRIQQLQECLNKYEIWNNKINSDLEEAKKLEIYNSDIHLKNIMIKTEQNGKEYIKITDWGQNAQMESYNVDLLSSFIDRLLKVIFMNLENIKDSSLDDENIVVISNLLLDKLKEIDNTREKDFIHKKNEYTSSKSMRSNSSNNILPSSGSSNYKKIIEKNQYGGSEISRGSNSSLNESKEGNVRYKKNKSRRNKLRTKKVYSKSVKYR